MEELESLAMKGTFVVTAAVCGGVLLDMIGEYEPTYCWVPLYMDKIMRDLVHWMVLYGANKSA